MRIPDAIDALARDMSAHFGARLQAFVAYGLHAHATADVAHDDHGHHASKRPAHTLAVVDRVSADDLRALAPRVDAWHEQGLATPLLLGAREFDRSLDAFPFELGAVMADYTVVSGRDPFAGLTVAGEDLRRACEIQARGHLLHLREACLESRGRSDALSDVIVRSAPALSALVTTFARLDDGIQLKPDQTHGHARAAAQAVEARLNVPPDSLSAVVGLAGVQEIPSAEADRLFPPYLAAVERLVEYIDSWRS